MTLADEYRHLAADLRARASKEASPFMKTEWNYLAYCYDRLAEQAEKNHRTNRAYEPLLHG